MTKRRRFYYREKAAAAAKKQALIDAWGGKPPDQVRKTPLVGAPFLAYRGVLTTIKLPRQAPDKRKETRAETEGVFPS